MNLHEACLKIKAVVLDVDGVLTDGRIGYGLGSEDEIKFFDVRDGHGIKLAMRAGLLVGILSGRKSKANAKRAGELGLDFLIEGEKDKDAGFSRFLAERNLDAVECMYIGDDVVDARPMKRCGVAVAVGDAVAELDAVADFRTKAPGGRGAVREALELLLREQEKWDPLMKKYFG